MFPARVTERRIYLWIIVFGAVLIWSGVEPKDRFIWLLEAAPALAAALLLALTYRAFRLTPLLYGLILAHCVILLVGAHYTYAEVPLFDSLRDALGSTRNNYDKLGHFAQGFVPALVVREIVLRKQVIRGAGWQFPIIVFFCLGISAFYELIEWWVALATGEDAAAFLGTQGYAWDTQSDMGYALLGACLALLALGRVHDRQLRRLPGGRAAPPNSAG